MKRHRRKSIRLNNWDYSTPWWYYITITTKNYKKFFGIQRESTIILNDFGKRVDKFWKDIPEHYIFVELDKYIIMPNHIHGIIIMNHQTTVMEKKDVWTGHAPSVQNINTLGNIVGSFKSAVTRWAHMNGISEFNWKSRFFQRIIRDDTELFRIRRYIEENPIDWDQELEWPENLDF